MKLPIVKLSAFIIARAAVLLFLAGCASQPDKIGTAYVSTLHYQQFTCQQVEMEMERVSARAIELRHSLKKLADNDEMQMGVGLLILWPTLFFLEGGDGIQAQEYARLKGERDALEKTSIQKQCGHKFTPIAPKPKKSEEKT